MDLEGTTSDEILEHVARKKEILKAKKLFEASAQVPSPSKDFCHLLVTEKGVVLRRWKISIRGISLGSAPAPTEDAMTHQDFMYDVAVQSDVERIFGAESLRQIKRILSGCRDELSKLPEKLMIKIVSHLDLQSIAQLSQVNRHLREVCNSNALWKQLYHYHQGVPTGEVLGLASELGWKQVFYMNKLQLQKELSRRRRNVRASPSKTFLTQEI